MSLGVGIFVSVVLILAVYHKGFRKVLLWSAGVVAVLTLLGAGGYFAYDRYTTWQAHRVAEKQEAARDRATIAPSVEYVITAHTVVQLKPVYLGGILQTGLPTQEDDYTVVYGTDVLKAKYASSQTSSAKPGDAFGTGLHAHSYDYHPDLSQVPQVGVPIRRCRLSTDKMPDGSPIIATQPTLEPCMVQIGDTLEYLPSPNSGDGTYVEFDILSEGATGPGQD